MSKKILFVGGPLDGHTTNFPSNVFAAEDGMVYERVPFSWHNDRNFHRLQTELFVVKGSDKVTFADFIRSLANLKLREKRENA